MGHHSLANHQFGLSVAKRIAELPDSEWPDFVVDLRKRRALSKAVREMNSLIQIPDHRHLAVRALRRIGLEHSG